jgi:hypothetical protein
MYDLNGFFNIPISSRILNSKEWWQPRHGMDLKIQFEQRSLWLLNVEWHVVVLRVTLVLKWVLRGRSAACARMAGRFMAMKCDILYPASVLPFGCDLLLL